MDKVVLSVDGSPASHAAVQWCVEHLEPGTTVIAVCGIGSLGEFVMSLPPFYGSVSEASVEDALLHEWTRPLREAGLRCEPRLVHQRQSRALLDVVEREQPDALVVGKVAHHALTDLLRDPLDHVLHCVPCPIVLVPASASQAHPMSAPLPGGAPC